MIDSFSGEYEFLSNFYYAPITYNGIKYRTSEAAYQAAKSTDIEVHHKFSGISARDSKNEGRKLTLREDWEDVKISIMYDILYCKFTQHFDLREKLLATNEIELVEGNTWNDIFWGVCKGNGENHLGKTLTKLREELR